MKKLLLVLLLLGGSFQWAFAAIRAEVNVMEATENIRYLSQRITRNYLYLYANPLKKEVESQIRKDLEELVASIRTISMSTSDEDTKNILEFLTYSKDQISELIKAKPDKQKAALMLDYSETLLEGANSIAAAHRYAFGESEKMLIQSKNIEYLTERSAKYYIALGVGLGSEVNRQQMNHALQDLETTLKGVLQHQYPSSMGNDTKALESIWNVRKNLYLRRKKVFVSNLVVLSTEEMENLAGHFVDYYRKNQ